MRLQPREVTPVVEDEIVSPRLRGVGCYVLTTQAHPEERSREWRLEGGAVNESFPPSRNPRGLSGLGRGVSCSGLAVSLFRELLSMGELPWL